MIPNPAEREPVAHPVRYGVLFWCVFSVVAVIVRGVRWDENYEFAQVILGQVPFPEGHPLYQYVHRFYSLQPFGLAVFMDLVPGPIWANGIRNVLFLLSSTVPAYLWGAHLGRRPLAGHGAALFILLEIHTTFYSSYPIHVWPDIFSNGPIGLGYMLVAAWALSDNRPRLAGLLLGFAPLIHLGQFPPLLATATLYAVWNLRQGRFPIVRQLVLATLPGLAAGLLFALFLRSFAVPPPVEGPYYTDVDPMVLWHTFMDRYASHRAIPYTSGHLVLVAALLVSIQLLVHRRLTKSDRPTGWLDEREAWAIVYMAIAAGTVWTIMGIHRIMGPDIPFLLAGWIPYRLMNHVAPVLIPLALGIGFRQKAAPPIWLAPLLLLALLAPLCTLISPDFASRYLSGDYLFFILVGTAMGTLALQIGSLGRTWGLCCGAGAIGTLGALACFHQFGAACMALGMVASAIPAPARLAPRIAETAGLALCALLAIAMTVKQGERRQHLEIPYFLEVASAYLAEQGDDDAMLLVPYQQSGMQMLSGHPVMADMATLFHGIYQPVLAPSAAAIFADFYGIYLDPLSPAPDANRAWHEVWPAKPLAEWQRLGEKYDLRYVVAPSFMRLPLERVVRGAQLHLYRIPDTGPAAE